MKSRSTLEIFIPPLLLCALLAGFSCDAKTVRQDGTAETAESMAAREIVLIHTAAATGVSGDDISARRLFLADPSDFSPSDQLSRLLASLADDSTVRAIVVSPALRGTGRAFASLHEKRPDLLLYAIDSEDDYLEIEESADFVVSADQEAGAYSAVWAAARLGCRRFVHVASRLPVPGSDSEHRREVLVKAAAEFGLEYTEALLSSNGKPIKTASGAAEAPPVYVEAVPLVIRSQSLEGKTAFYVSGESIQGLMLTAILQEGGIAAGMYPGSFLLAHPELAGAYRAAEDPAGLLAGLEKAIGLQGGSGRVVLPGFPEREAMETAAVLFLRRALEKKSAKPDAEQFHEFLKLAASNISWRVDYSMDRQTGVRSRNHLLVFQDLYLIGRGYLPFTKGTIPESYRR